MRKTPSYLKGLAENRARIAGDLNRMCRLFDELEKSIASAKVELDSCDVMIARFDKRLDPSAIASIRGWQGRYGKRGELIAAVTDYLKNAWPEDVATVELCWHLELKFSLDFISQKERTRWIENTLRGRLRALVNQGKLERCHSGSGGYPTKEVGRWRWVMDDAVPSGDQLRAQATAAGLSTQQRGSSRA